MRASPYDALAYRPATINALTSASIRRTFVLLLFLRYFVGTGTIAVPVALSFGQIRIVLPPGRFWVMT